MKDIKEIKEIYNGLYNKRYNNRNNNYNKLTLPFAEKIDGQILDAGCGRGHASKMLIEAGHDVFAIELSETCCERFLQDIPHKCVDIITHCEEAKYAGIVCMGVLEHIPYEAIDDTLEALSMASNSVLVAIANHTDVQSGVELHIIKENKEWWEDKLLQAFDNAELTSRFRDRLYVFECYNTLHQETILHVSLIN